jgi:hypothetical protein
MIIVVLQTAISPWQFFFLSFLEQTLSILLSRRESASFIALTAVLRANEMLALTAPEGFGQLMADLSHRMKTRSLSFVMIEATRSISQSASIGLVTMTPNYFAPKHKIDTIQTNIRNDSNTSLATWQWRAKVPLIGDESSRRCVVGKLKK